MANENLHPKANEMWSEPDGCLYAYCPGAEYGCDTAGFVPFGKDIHFQPTELEQLTLIIEQDGRIVTDQLPIGGKGIPGVR